MKRIIFEKTVLVKAILLVLLLQTYIGLANAASEQPSMLNEHNLQSSNNNVNESTAKMSTVIRAVPTSRMEFKSFIQAEFIKSYAQHQLNRVRASRRPIHLSSLLKKSQEEFLSHNPSSALKTYRMVIDQMHSFDWNKEEREIIFYILFRSAQLEPNVERKKLFLHEAMVFGQDLKLDFSLFPPPLMKIYLNIKKVSVFVPVNLKKIFLDHELVVINGRVYPISQPVFLPYGTYRVSAFSSSYTPWAKVISLSRLVSQVVRTQALVSGGDCQQGGKLNIVNKEDPAMIKVLFPNFCVWNTAKKTIDKVHFKERAGWQANVFSKNWSEQLSVENVTKWTIVSGIVTLGAVILFASLNDKVVDDRMVTGFPIKSDNSNTQQMPSKPMTQPVIQVGF